jgi:aryl-alcohol dehydrogenase-like predicted oxidoreductase
MRYVTGLGDTLATGKKISKIGLGTWQFGSGNWGYGKDYAERESHQIVRRALELGITTIDTAEIYGLGASERIVGESLREVGAELAETAFVATKIFPVLPVGPVVEQRGLASARRLGVRRLDLYQVHQPNPVVKDGPTMRGMRALREVGLVDQVGVSNYSLARWQDAEAALGSPVLSNQVEYSLVRRSPDETMIPYAQRVGRLVIAFSPLAQGLLSGRYDVTHQPTGNVRVGNPLFLTENLARAAPLLDVLREVAAAHDATCAQIALAWTIHQPCVVAIPGASSVAQVEANAAAAQIELTDDQYTALTDAAAKFTPLAGPAAWAAIATERIPVRFAGRSSR